MTSPHLDDIARLPLPGDNVAIATRRLEKGARIQTVQGILELDATVLEGHRFALEPIRTGRSVLSWNLPFGTAIQDIAPGQYICNEDMLEALRLRSIALDLPARPNFESRIPPFHLDAANFRPGPPTGRHAHTDTFPGYPRSGNRGTGTRNCIILLGTSSLTGGFVRALEDRLRADADTLDNIDGIVAVSHTEGGVPDPNNLELVLRTLAGYFVHPNTGGILAVDYGSEAINNTRLRSYLEVHGYPLHDVPHAFLSLETGFAQALEQAAATVSAWYGAINACTRTERPAADLKIALQCGGSDAFSGISGNPLVAWIAREVIRQGGAANLAETDELIGAEPYVLQNVRDLQTARRFLAVVARFKQRAQRHGHTAADNPSGGNKLRGLYNIYLKSIGAAMKRHPEVRLDSVLEYGERIMESGYHFMDSPGNDLESIAGQVASGCNLIFFVTGNGSITNFPFVPTVKVVTTTARYELLHRDMDINAGQYLDGVDMDTLGQALYRRTLQVAGGQRSLGEQAGHAQIQLWRNWALDTDAEKPQAVIPPLPGKAIQVPVPDQISAFSFTGVRHRDHVIPHPICLIVPTSLCSGQIAHMAVRRLRRSHARAGEVGPRFATLVHTEGCGVSAGASEALYARTLTGYIQHPQVQHCLLLEHGCEKTHNDFMQHVLREAGVDTDGLGWASVQLDGGIARVLHKMDAWFGRQLAAEAEPETVRASMEQLRIGLASHGCISPAGISLLARCAGAVACQGGMAVVPAGSAIAEALSSDTGPTLAYAQAAPEHGLHFMDCPTPHWVESLSGLGATGVDLVIVHVEGPPVQGHPLIPTLQVTTVPAADIPAGMDLDLQLEAGNDPAENLQTLFNLAGAVLSGQYQVRSMQIGNIDFQITRGPVGISM